jgi:hypothetical protein
VTANRLTADSSEDAERRLVEGWRAMSAEEKLVLSLSMTQAVRDLALAGIRLRYPDADSREQFLRLAILQLGPELALAVYPEIAASITHRT